MNRLLKSLTFRVIGLLASALSFNSCFLDQGTDQLHGMFDVKYSSTAVCDSQQKLILFRNVSGEEIVIEGVAISVGTDPLGNFSLASVIIGSEEQPSINGVLQDVHVPAGSNYSLKVGYSPKTENTTHQAVLDIAYKSPQEGVIQVALEGESTTKAETCPNRDEGGPVGLDGDVLLTVELMIAATSAISAPINTNQGQQPFVPIDLALTLSIIENKVTIHPFTDDTFVLPPPRLDVPGIGGIIQGSTLITIPEGGEGTYDAATGFLEVPDLLIQMDGELDFSADLVLTLTTGRLSLDSITPKVNKQALQQFGDPSHWDSVDNKNEIFGSPIDSETGKVFLVGVTKLKNVQLKPGARSELTNLPTASMAVLIEGTIQKPPSTP